MICPACKKIISDDDGGVQIKDYLFCTPNCLFAYFTIDQIKRICRQ